jgi:hypothetical protein
LQKLDRGAVILDGAGAALQGKERPYIFYYWDISDANMMAFRPGKVDIVVNHAGMHAA